MTKTHQDLKKSCLAQNFDKTSPENHRKILFVSHQNPFKYKTTLKFFCAFFIFSNGFYMPVFIAFYKEVAKTEIYQFVKFQPSGEGGTRLLPAMPH